MKPKLMENKKELAELFATKSIAEYIVEAEKEIYQLNRQRAVRLAKIFHDAYEVAAPSFGYKTRKSTRDFDENSPNGRLMISVCENVIIKIIDYEIETAVERALENREYEDEEGI